jgi:isopenicillin N synthase-like dioxygenase
MTYEEPANIPVVDFALLQGTPEERKPALQLLDQAFQACGFVYISNHGIPQKMVDEAFSWVSFFSIALFSIFLSWAVMERNMADRCAIGD